MSDKPETLQTVVVWDLPTRLFHWTLVVLVIAQWLTAEESGTMDWHVWGGYAVLTLVLFRLLWGSSAVRLPVSALSCADRARRWNMLEHCCVARHLIILATIPWVAGPSW